MEIDVVRDWIIVVYGAVGVVAVCVMVALAILLYRKVTKILDTVREPVESVRQTPSVIHDSVVQPIAKAQGFFAGMRKAMEVVTSLMRKGDEEDGE